MYISIINLYLHQVEHNTSGGLVRGSPGPFFGSCWAAAPSLRDERGMELRMDLNVPLLQMFGTLWSYSAGSHVLIRRQGPHMSSKSTHVYSQLQFHRVGRFD